MLPGHLGNATGPPGIPQGGKMSRTICFITLGLALAIGCSDETSGAGGNGAGGSGGSGGVGGVDSSDPLFVIAQVLSTPTGFQGFATLIDGLDEDTTVDLANSIEVPEFSGVFQGPRPGTFFVSTGQVPEVALFELGDDDIAREVDRISFAGRGVTVPEAAHTVVPISETKAYYVDAASLRLFTFNPETMMIQSETSLDGLAPTSLDNPVTIVLPVPVARSDGELILHVLYRNLAEGTNEQLVRVAFIDKATDEVTITEDDRCGFMTNVVLTPSGDLYLGSDAWAGAQQFTLPDVNPAPCMLRIRAGERQFDPDFRVFFSDVAEEAISGSLIGGSGNVAYMLSYDRSVVDPSGLTDLELLAVESWRTYRVTLGDTVSPAVEVEELPVRSGSVFPITVGGEIYDAVTSAGFGETTLFRTTVDGLPERALTADGFLVGIVRLR